MPKQAVLGTEISPDRQIFRSVQDDDTVCGVTFMAVVTYANEERYVEIGADVGMSAEEGTRTTQKNGREAYELVVLSFLAARPCTLADGYF